jgi:uncharacterized protein
MNRFILFIPFILATSLANAASFDCAKASTRIEKTICADQELSGLDSQLMQVYKTALADNHDTEATKAEQRAWLSTVRNRCEDAQCLKQAYAARITALGGAAGAAEQSVGAAGQASGPGDQPAAALAPASAAQAQDAQASPVASPTPPAAPVAAQASAPAQAASATTSSASPASPPSATKPGVGISGLFSVLFSIGMLALIAGLVRPTLAARWIAAPSRKKLFVIALAYLVPMAALSHFTKTKDQIAYEQSVNEQKEAARQQKVQAEQAAQEAAATARPVASSRSPVNDAPPPSRYKRAADNFIEVATRAVQSGAVDRNPACADAQVSYYKQFFEIGQTLEQAKVDYRGDPASYNAIKDLQAQILEVNAANLAAICR